MTQALLPPSPFDIGQSHTFFDSLDPYFNMSSHLRLQSSFEPFQANATIQTSPSLPPAKKQKMSLTQTYYVASTARSKLGREAGRADHDLRRLVGHANLLDTLMVELADAEREQESWFHQSVTTASTPEEATYQPWSDTLAADEYEDDSDMESDDGSEIYDEAEELFNIPIRKLRSPQVEFSCEAMDDEDMHSDNEVDEDLDLTRAPTNQHSPPELTLDSDSSDSDEDDIPSSPEQPLFELSDKERAQIATTTFYDIKSSSAATALLAQQHQQPMIAAC